jgi:hypothetical protein
MSSFIFDHGLVNWAAGPVVIAAWRNNIPQAALHSQSR